MFYPAYMCAYRITHKLYAYDLVYCVPIQVLNVCTQGGGDGEKIANVHKYSEYRRETGTESGRAEPRERIKKEKLRTNIKNTCLLHITWPESPVYSGLILVSHQNPSAHTKKKTNKNLKMQMLIRAHNDRTEYDVCLCFKVFKEQK